MQFIYLLFIALINSIDNIGIGVAYSIAGIKVQFLKNILISSLAFAVSFLASLSGNIISHFLSEQMCSIISMLLLVFMGTRMIYQSFTKEEPDDIEKMRAVSYKDALYVGTALALDDIGSSVSSGLIGYTPFMVGLPYFIVSFFIFFSGNYASKLFSKLNIGKKATVIAGSLMVLIGILQFFD